MATRNEPPIQGTAAPASAILRRVPSGQSKDAEKKILAYALKLAFSLKMMAFHVRPLKNYPVGTLTIKMPRLNSSIQSGCSGLLMALTL